MDDVQVMVYNFKESLLDAVIFTKCVENIG